MDVADKRVFLVNLAQITLADLTRIPLAILGRFQKGSQKFAITKQTIFELVANFRKRLNGETVIDYDHASEFPEVAQGQPIPAAGWLKEIDDAPDAKGILWGHAEFTDRARALIEAKEYKYLSPAIHLDTRDKVSGEPQGATLGSIGLTNRPFLEAMPAIQLSEAWVADTTDHEQTKGNPMVKQVILTDRAAAKARVVMDDGTEATLSVEGLTPEPKVLRLSDVPKKDGRFDFASLDSANGLIDGEVFHAMQAQLALDEAVKAGKITPAQRPHYERLALSDLASFNALAASMKPQLDFSERGFGGSGEEGGDLAKAELVLDQKVREKMAADKSLQYHQALKIVASENPELDRRRTQMIREKVS